MSSPSLPQIPIKLNSNIPTLFVLLTFFKKLSILIKVSISLYVYRMVIIQRGDITSPYHKKRILLQQDQFSLSLLLHFHHWHIRAVVNIHSLQPYPPLLLNEKAISKINCARSLNSFFINQISQNRRNALFQPVVACACWEIFFYLNYIFLFSYSLHCFTYIL